MPRTDSEKRTRGKSNKAKGGYYMPIIQVNLLQGRSAEVKRKYAADLTKLTCECLNAPPEAVRIIFNEMAHENYAIAGTLAADRKK